MFHPKAVILVCFKTWQQHTLEIIHNRLLVFMRKVFFQKRQHA